MLFLIYFALIAVAKSARRENIFSPKIVFDNDDEIGSSDFGSCPIWSNRVPNKKQTPPDTLNGSGAIERLVVYLYRNKITDNIHLITPKKKSQYCFPDLGTDDEGDSMSLDSDELHELLDSNPNIITIPSSDNIDKGIVISPHNEHLPTSITEEDDDFDQDEEEYQFSEETSIIKHPSDNPYYDEDILPISPFEISDFVDEEEVSDFTDLQEPTLNTPKQHGNDWTDKGIANVAGKDIFLPLRALLGKQMTFDEWFTQQLRRFVGERFNKNLNVRMLKSTIEKILRDNSIFIRNDGVLIDHGGMVINPSNLNLRPILIGDSVAYRKILSLRDGTTFSFPSNSPYLDTLMVSQVFPPRLLGIIPLGKTFIPKRSKRKIINHEHRQPDSKFISATVLFPEDKTHAHLVSKKRNVVNEHVPTTKKQRRPDEKETNASVIAPRNAPNIFSLLKTFKSLNGQGLGKIIEPILDSIQPSEKNDSKHENPPFSEYEDLEMDDDLGFKIIGGNAATSSGTPISSKGRTSNFFDFDN